MMSRSTGDVAKIVKLLLDRNFSYSKIEAYTGVNRYYLWNIVNRQGYKPPRWVAKRLGMGNYRDLLAIPKKELRWAIEHRKEM
jgi:hypothetical protein